MANTISPNMGLIVPGVGTEPGPTWATDLNADLGILDQHNHSAGQGVQITPAGLNINTDLPMNGNNLTTVKTVNFTSQLASLPGTSPNLGCVYVAGAELYYNDEAGNVVQITNMGSVNAGAGSITGLPSGTASASYSAGSQTFIWQSATSTAANMDMGSIIIRELVPSANGITISSPGSLAAPYTLTLLPSLPASNKLMTLDSGGNISSTNDLTTIPGLTIGSANIADGSVTQEKIAIRTTGSTVGTGGFAVSALCSSFAVTSSSFQTITNLTVTITTLGNPVRLALMTTNSIGDLPGSIQLFSTSHDDQADCSFVFLRSGTIITQQELQNIPDPTSGAILPLSTISPDGLSFYDLPPAGTYTYTVQGKRNTSNSRLSFNNINLIAYEIK